MIGWICFALLLLSQRWIRDVKQANERLEKHWIVWNVRTNRHVNSLAAKYKPVEVRQVRFSWLWSVHLGFGLHGRSYADSKA